MKRCTKCGNDYQATSEFFCSEKRNRNGLHGQCKECKKLYDKAYRIKNKARIDARIKRYVKENSQQVKESRHKGYVKHREERLDRMKVYAKSHPEVNRKASKTYAEKNPEKKKAHQLLNAAVRAGKILRPEICEQCKKKSNVEAHHEDYSKPYDVEWLCRKCHNSHQ